MLKMVLTVPRGFDAEQFCHVVSQVTDSWQDRRDWHDYDLAEWLRCRKTAANDIEEYEVDAGLVDFGIIDTIEDLQRICPQVEMHFEGDGEIAPEFEDDEWYYSELY